MFRSVRFALCCLLHMFAVDFSIGTDSSTSTGTGRHDARSQILSSPTEAALMSAVLLLI